MLSQYTPEQLSTFFGGTSTLVVILGTMLAIWNLRIIARASQLAAFDAFERRWEEMKDVRHRVFDTFVFDPTNPPDLNSPTGQEVREVINNINVVGSMVERRMLPARLVLGLCYPDFIRYHYILADYLEHRSAELGLPYGARVERMAARAKRYHELRHFHSRVRTRDRSGDYVEVFVSTPREGWRRLAFALERHLRRVSGRY